MSLPLDFLAMAGAPYAIYMTNCFVTSVCLDAPWNMTDRMGGVWYHRRSGKQRVMRKCKTGNKICTVGKVVGWLLALWVVFFVVGRRVLPEWLFHSALAQKLNLLIWALTIAGGFVMNWNFMAYMLPLACMMCLYGRRR